MLVLTRKAQQQIRVGNNVVITILRVKGQAVRVGIDAPKNVRVVRAELPMLSDAADNETEVSVEIAPAKPVTSSEHRQHEHRQQASFGKSTVDLDGPVPSRVAPASLSMGLAARIAERQRMGFGKPDGQPMASTGDSRLPVGLGVRS